MTRLEPGDKAPAFTLLDQDEKTVKLADYKGEHLLVYFYPRASTSGCTRQSVAVSEARRELADRGVQAVGISPDNPGRQRRFADKQDLHIPLLADEDAVVARAYGAWGVKNIGGNKKEGIIRSSFLIDPKGRIVRAWYKVKPEDTVPKALAAIDEA